MGTLWITITFSMVDILKHLKTFLRAVKDLLMMMQCQNTKHFSLENALSVLAIILPTKQRVP
jgi:hypothetical protein